jgi:hypothetical protein
MKTVTVQMIVISDGSSLDTNVKGKDGTPAPPYE